MIISEETKKLIVEINDSSKHPIKNNYEVSVILEATRLSVNQNTFSQLIFTAKYITGLKKVLSNRIINDDKYMEGIFTEFNNNVEKYVQLTREIVSSLDENVINHFRKKYFELSQECLAESLVLAEDLSICKEYYNNRDEARKYRITNSGKHD